MLFPKLRSRHFFFGVSPQRFYGCHHLPQVTRGKTFAVVLYSPIGQEYLQSHRVLYQLAVLLAKAGFHVLRFDYFGCGDSEGEFTLGSLGQWTKDSHCALEEIQKRSGLTRVCLIGLRLGAILAAQVAVDCPDVDNLVLWQPISNGGVYLNELAEAHQTFFGSISFRVKDGFGLPRKGRAE